MRIPGCVSIYITTYGEKGAQGHDQGHDHSYMYSYI